MYGIAQSSDHDITYPLTLNRFALRRVAVRALSQQPSRHLSSSTFRPQTTRVIISQQSSILRSFHQSTSWLAEEKTASPVDTETSGETVTTSPSAAEEQTREEVLGSSGAQASSAEDALSEASGTTAEPIDSPHDIKHETTESAPALNTSSYDANAMPSSTSGVEASDMSRSSETHSNNSSSLVDRARDVASSAADTIQDVSAAAAQSARSAFDNTARSMQKPSAEFPPQTPAPAAASSKSQYRDRSANPKNNTLYVGNLFFEVTGPQLENEFGRFGPISSVRIVTDPRGLSKGFGYVEFSDQESADRAVRELDQKVLEGRRMAVQYHVQKDRAPRGMQSSRDGMQGGRDAMGGARRFGERPSNPPSKTLFIGNMSYQMSDRDLNDLFREIRNVLDVRVAIDRRSGQPRGFAHADFIDTPSAEKAKEYLEKKVIYGRQLKIDFSAESSGKRQEEGAGDRL
ncbi:hypothetical protein LTR62_002176 [Meristemomyces frigidus]|uniref:RRM domain-containing protein n=1 Tax=Meristemomyces frigidus TaxID=1508187 RepID=A0AAN7TAG1_9PEZI|nr:hypothetical protein LTR62_002176 [Meristemomyces frigidus]